MFRHVLAKFRRHVSETQLSNTIFNCNSRNTPCRWKQSKRSYILWLQICLINLQNSSYFSILFTLTTYIIILRILIYEFYSLIHQPFLYSIMSYFVYTLYFLIICLNYEFKDIELCIVSHFNTESFKSKIKVFSGLPYFTMLPIFPCSTHFLFWKDRSPTRNRYLEPFF